MFINDVGEGTWEEINDGIAGANYGWPSSEGPTSNPAHRGPIFYYGHAAANDRLLDNRRGFLQSGVAAVPAEYVGQYFFADFCSNWIRLLDPSFAASNFATGAPGPVDLLVSYDGRLYYLARGRAPSSASDTRPARPPRSPPVP